MKRTTFAAGAGAVVAIIAGLLVVLATRSFDAPGLGAAVSREAQNRVGIEIESSRSTFGLFEGLSLEDVTVSSDLPVGGYRARLDAIRFEDAPLSLLKGRLELVRVVLERPQVVIDASAGERADRRGSAPATGSDRRRPVPAERGPGEAPRPPSPASARDLVDFDLAPRALLLRDGAISIPDSTSGGHRFTLEGLRVELSTLAYDRRAITPLHALTSRGELAAAILGVGNLRLSDVTAALETGGGRFRLDDLRFRHSEAGAFQGGLEVDFNSIPFRYRASVSAAAIDLGRLTRMPSAMKGLLRLEAAGFGTDSGNLTGSGRLELEGGRFPASAWLSEIDASLPGADYGPSSVSFTLGEGRVAFDGWKLDSPRVALVMSGSITFEDEVDLEIDASRDGNESRYRLRGALADPVLTRRDRSGESRSVPRADRRGR